MPRAAQYKCTDTLRYISTAQWKALLVGDTRFLWEWDGEEPLIVHVEVSGNTVTLTNQAYHRVTVRLDTTPCHYGGNRVWFICQACGKRATKLYISQLNLSCRKCNRLVYRSQRQTKPDRLFLMASKISSTLAYGKPKHMTQATYLALQLKHDELMNAAVWLHIATHKRLASKMLSN